MQSDTISVSTSTIGLIVGGLIFLLIQDKSTALVVAVFATWLTMAHLHLRQQNQAAMKRLKDLEWEVGTYLSGKK